MENKINIFTLVRWLVRASLAANSLFRACDSTIDQGTMCATKKCKKKEGARLKNALLSVLICARELRLSIIEQMTVYLIKRRNNNKIIKCNEKINSLKKSGH